MENNTFIKLNRKILKWGWYKDINTFKLFVHLLLTANIRPGEFLGQSIERGQLVTSRLKLSAETGLTERQVRTSLNHLISTNEVTKTTTAKFTIITINNYDKYQKSTKTATSDRPTSDQQTTSDRPQYKKVKNIKNVKNGKKREGRNAPNSHGSAFYCFGEFKNVRLTKSDYARLTEKHSEDDVKAKIERLSQYMRETGKHYANHCSVLLRWLEEDAPATNQNKPDNKQKASYDIDSLEEIVDAGELL